MVEPQSELWQASAILTTLTSNLDKFGAALTAIQQSTIYTPDMLKSAQTEAVSYMANINMLGMAMQATGAGEEQQEDLYGSKLRQFKKGAVGTKEISEDVAMRITHQAQIARGKGTNLKLFREGLKKYREESQILKEVQQQIDSSKQQNVFLQPDPMMQPKYTEQIIQFAPDENPFATNQQVNITFDDNFNVSQL